MPGSNVVKLVGEGARQFDPRELVVEPDAGAVGDAGLCGQVGDEDWSLRACSLSPGVVHITRA